METFENINHKMPADKDLEQVSAGKSIPDYIGHALRKDTQYLRYLYTGS